MASGDRWFFERVAGLYDLVMPRARAGPLLAGLELADGPVERVIDVGGGTGRAVRAIDAPQRVVMDISPGMLRRVPFGIDRLLGSATAIPVADGAADALLIVDALHHFPDHDDVLREAYRVLRPGGVLVVREFNRATIRGRLLEAAEHAIRMESSFRTAAGLRDHLEAVGFDAQLMNGGFTCTVVGRKPGRP